MPNVNDLNKYLSVTEVKNGDVLIFTNEGNIIEKDFSQKKDGSDMRSVLEIEVELPNGKKRILSPNKTSRKAISEKYGVETEEWLNKSVTVSLVKQNVGGTLRDVIYLEPLKA